MAVGDTYEKLLNELVLARGAWRSDVVIGEEQNSRAQDVLTGAAIALADFVYNKQREAYQVPAIPKPRQCESISQWGNYRCILPMGHGERHEHPGSSWPVNHGRGWFTDHLCPQRIGPDVCELLADHEGNHDFNLRFGHA